LFDVARNRAILRAVERTSLYVFWFSKMREICWPIEEILEYHMKIYLTGSFRFGCFQCMLSQGYIENSNLSKFCVKVRRRQSIKKPNFFFIYCFTYNLIQIVSFKLLPSSLDTPHPTFFSQFCNASWNVFCGMAQRYLIEFYSMSSTVWNQRYFCGDFNFGKKRKSAGAKSGE
jgi:hypothetical protein